MFSLIYINRIKCILRDKETIFWTLLFPLLLATLFNMAFSNLGSSEVFKAINVAVVDDAKYQADKNFKEVLDEVSKGEDKIFKLTVASKDKAAQLLKENTIDGYIVVEDQIKLVVKNSGINQNIIKSFIDNYNHTTSAVTSILTENPMKAQELLKDIGTSFEYTKEVPGTSNPPNFVLNYFYALIAMTCFYGSFMGNKEVINIQANLSSLAARINVTPVHKLKVFLYSMSAAVTIHFAEMLVLLAYLYYGLKIDFGSKSGYVLLTTFIGTIAGLSFGAFVSSLIKKGEGVKIAVIISISMLGSFLSGMMYEDMKYIISKNAPLLSYINPVNLLTDAFYSLYYYDTYTRYALNMVILCVFIVIFCTGTFLMVRRRKYASL